MSETMAGVVHVVFPHAAEAAADEGVASVIEVLQEHLGLAREGKLRSVAVVSVSADGSAIGTQWSCTHGDIAALIGKLTVLTHDNNGRSNVSDAREQGSTQVPTHWPELAWVCLTG